LVKLSGVNSSIKMKPVGNDLKGILFPLEKRKWRGSRAARITLRTIHLLSFSVLFGGHWFGLPRTELAVWLYLTVFTGAGLMTLELYSSFDWILQLAGTLVLLKLAILILTPVFWEHRIALLTIVMIIGSVGSHMPAALRHFYLLPFRQTGFRP